MKTRTKKRPAEHVKNSRPVPLTPAQLAHADDAAVIRHLLQVCLERLDAGRSLERQRAIVYPEITCIVRDVERLQRRLREIEGKTPAADGQPIDDHPGDVTTDPSAANGFWDK